MTKTTLTTTTTTTMTMLMLTTTNEKVACPSFLCFTFREFSVFADNLPKHEHKTIKNPMTEIFALLSSSTTRETFDDDDEFVGEALTIPKPLVMNPDETTKSRTTTTTTTTKPETTMRSESRSCGATIDNLLRKPRRARHVVDSQIGVLWWLGWRLGNLYERLPSLSSGATRVVDIDELCDELWLAIFQEIKDFDELVTVRMVCRRFRRIASDRLLQQKFFF